MDNSQAKKVFSKFGLVYTAAYWALAVVLTVIGLIVYAVSGNSLAGTASIVTELVLRFAVMYPVMILIMKKVPTFEIKKNKLGFGKFIACIFITFAVMYLATIVGFMINSLVGNLIGTGAVNHFAEVVDNMPKAIRIIAIPILAPVFEELIFRKVLIDRIVGYGEVLAMLVSGFMFGLYHMNLLQFIYATAIGIFFAFIYIRTGKIWYTIVLHLIINGFSTFLNTFMTDGIDVTEINNYLSSGDMDGYMNYINENAAAIASLSFLGMFVILATIIGTILMIVMRKKFVFEHREGEIEKGQRFKTAILNPGMLIYVIYFAIEIILMLYRTNVFSLIGDLFT